MSKDKTKSQCISVLASVDPYNPLLWDSGEGLICHHQKLRLAVVIDALKLDLRRGK
jgi:hypothetical protein